MLVIAEKQVPVPGRSGENFLQKSRYAVQNWTKRSGVPISVCLHTRLGIWPQLIRTGGKNTGWARDFAARMNKRKGVSAHIAIEADGSYVCCADLVKQKTFHASQTNKYSIGIEMYQATDGTVFSETLDTCVAICDTISAQLSIPKRFPKEPHILQDFARGTIGSSKPMQLAYMAGGKEGREWAGFFGHRNATRNRGLGDPGQEIFTRLLVAGYVPV